MLNIYINRLIKNMFKMIYLEKKKKIKAIYAKNLIKHLKNLCFYLYIFILFYLFNLLPYS